MLFSVQTLLPGFHRWPAQLLLIIKYGNCHSLHQSCPVLLFHHVCKHFLTKNTVMCILQLSSEIISPHVSHRPLKLRMLHSSTVERNEKSTLRHGKRSRGTIAIVRQRKNSIHDHNIKLSGTSHTMEYYYIIQ